MAKKEVNSTTPQISKLPLPISDTPLVIDLPDGQKIVIGKLQAGSVIEVATWRGTGRPDSRTNRLMMGMNTSESSAAPEPAEDAASKEAATAAPAPASVKEKVAFILKKFLSQVKSLISKVSIKSVKSKAGSVKILKADEQNTTSLESATEVDEWLKKFLERSESNSGSATRPALRKAAVAKKSVATKRPAVAKRPTAVKKSAATKNNKK